MNYDDEIFISNFKAGINQEGFEVELNFMNPAWNSNGIISRIFDTSCGCLLVEINKDGKPNSYPSDLICVYREEESCREHVIYQGSFKIMREKQLAYRGLRFR